MFYHPQEIPISARRHQSLMWEQINAHTHPLRLVALRKDSEENIRGMKPGNMRACAFKSP